MKIIEYLEKNNIRYFPVPVKVEDGKKKFYPNGFNNSLQWYKMTDFRTINDEELNKRKSLLDKTDYIAIDTSKVNQIDCDDINKEYKNVWKKWKKEYPYYKSATKKLPHFFVKKPEDIKSGYNTVMLKNDKKEDILDYLHGKWAWCHKDSKVYNNDKEIDYAYEDYIPKNEVKDEYETESSDSEDEDDILTEELEKKVNILLNKISSTRADNYDTWLSVGMALYNTNFYLLKQWIRWSKQSSKYKKGECKKKWSSFDNKRKHKYNLNSLENWANVDSKHVTKHEHVYQRLYDESIDKLVDYMNKELCYMYGFNTETYYVIDDTVSKKILKSSKRALKENYSSYYIVNENNKEINPIDIWSKSLNKHQKRIFAMMPNYDNGKDYNLWRGYDISYDNCKDEKQSCKPILDHIYNIWCNKNKEHYDYVLNYFSSILQKPDKKLGVALVLKSEKEGAGKNIIMDKLRKIIGDNHSIEIADSDQVIGKFTFALSAKTMIVLDEAVWGGTKKDKGKIKNLVTAEQIKIEHKGKDSYTEDFYGNLIFMSNEDWVVPASIGSRRWFVLDLDNKYSGIQNQEKKEYFDNILDVSNSSFAKFLYERDISSFNPREFNNDNYMSQVINDLDSVEQFIFSLIDGEYKTKISKNELYKDYVQSCNTMRLKMENNINFYKKLHKIFDYKIYQTRETETNMFGEKKRIYKIIFPKITETKKLLHKKYKVSFD